MQITCNTTLGACFCGTATLYSNYISVFPSGINAWEQGLYAGANLDLQYGTGNRYSVTVSIFITNYFPRENFKILK